ncbi:indoleamine 2,3-dioxygenase [Marinobacterium arenosum]|uniref:indoleamine 2,3-dioxygenase n=1 Tax=Marinobacterium arenosum TaxID=2862496 RepID=UPI001C94E731|nr:indoleamine 2,3-dioxygenase [Marinobacterium arenosum]MBY4678000.1 indoleamine 2,3-dioxygenase [Marinobacterium arenosum]
MKDCFATRGFLPGEDPATELTLGEPFRLLDQLGHDLPSLLLEPGFRDFMRQQTLPDWPYDNIPEGLEPQARLYYVRLGFLASGYINQISQPPCHLLPVNLAVPLCKIAGLLERPPMLSYDGYTLYNWKRFDPAGPIALGNIDTLQNFVHLYDEHWFILVHVEIEALAAKIFDEIIQLDQRQGFDDAGQVDALLLTIAEVMERMIDSLERIPERMSDELYYSRFRPYISQFHDVRYEGTHQPPISYRGETGAQSTFMPVLTSLLKIPHEQNKLTRHLLDMRNYMPASHRQWLEWVDQLPDFRELASEDAFDNALEQMALFRELHYHWAIKYIARRSSDPQGTGGTPYLKWLKFLIDETRHYKKGAIQHPG